jgi:hypothetical protein
MAWSGVVKAVAKGSVYLRGIEPRSLEPQSKILPLNYRYTCRARFAFERLRLAAPQRFLFNSELGEGVVTAPWALAAHTTANAG